jgi:hypothetical protein
METLPFQPSRGEWIFTGRHDSQYYIDLKGIIQKLFSG